MGYNSMKMLVGVGVVCTLGGISARASAYSATCNMSFNSYISLSVLQKKAGYSILNAPPWYTQPCTASPNYIMLDEVPNDQGFTYQHVHLNVENTCVAPVSCDSDSWGLPASCSPTGTCQPIDAAAYPRTLSNHPSQRLRVTVTPTPSGGQYCIPDGGGGQSCIAVSGQFFSPRSIRVLGDSSFYSTVRVRPSYVFTVNVGTPGGTRHFLSRITLSIGPFGVGSGVNQIEPSGDTSLFDYMYLEGPDNFSFEADDIVIAR